MFVCVHHKHVIYPWLVSVCGNCVSVCVYLCIKSFIFICTHMCTMMAIQYPAAVCCRCKQKPLKKEKQRANSVSWFALSLSLPFSLFVGCLSVYRTPHRTHFMRFSVHFPKHTEREQVPIRCSNNTERTNRGKNTRVI